MKVHVKNIHDKNDGIIEIDQRIYTCENSLASKIVGDCPFDVCCYQ